MEHILNMQISTNTTFVGPVPPAQNPQRLSKHLLPTYPYKNPSKFVNQIMTEFLAARVPFWPSELRKWVCFRITPEKKQAYTVSSESLLDSQQNGLVSEVLCVLPREDKMPATLGCDYLSFSPAL